MDTIFVIVNLLVASFAFVAPWATIDAFDATCIRGMPCRLIPRFFFVSDQRGRRTNSSASGLPRSG